VIRSVKQYNNMDTVLHGPMPSERCRRSMSGQGRHAFIVHNRGLGVPSVTADLQIIEVAGCRRTGVPGIGIV
jgi:hypothetical protein